MGAGTKRVHEYAREERLTRGARRGIRLDKGDSLPVVTPQFSRSLDRTQEVAGSSPASSIA